MTEMPPGRPSEPRTGPVAPAPAHGDGPTGPSTPTGHTELRDRITEALTTERWGSKHALGEHGTGHSFYAPCGICQGDVAAILRLVLPVVEAETAALRERAVDAEDRLRKATDAYTRLHAEATGTEATGDRWRQRAKKAERERDTAREALDAAAIVIASLRDQRDQARDAIADERRGRLAAEAAVRRVRELHAPEDDPRRVRDCKGCRTHVSFVPYEDCKTLAALDAEQPKETR